MVKIKTKEFALGNLNLSKVKHFRWPNPPVPCEICYMHVDSQNHAVNCVETMKNVKESGKYEDIFTNNISVGTAVMLEKIVEYRENKLG